MTIAAVSTRSRSTLTEGMPTRARARDVGRLRAAIANQERGVLVPPKARDLGKRDDSPSAPRYSRIDERSTARPSAKREYGVRPAPLSWSSRDLKPVCSCTSFVVGVETTAGCRRQVKCSERRSGELTDRNSPTVSKLASPASELVPCTKHAVVSKVPPGPRAKTHLRSTEPTVRTPTAQPPPRLPRPAP